MDLKEKAGMALREQRCEMERNAEAQRREEGRDLAKTLERHLGVKVVTPLENEVTVDGITFVMDTDEGKLRIQGKCPDCLQPTHSRFVLSLTDLGEMLEHFVPAYYHDKECFVKQARVATKRQNNMEELRRLLKWLVGMERFEGDF